MRGVGADRANSSRRSAGRERLRTRLAPELYEVYRLDARSAYVRREHPSRAAFGSETITNGRRIGCAGRCVKAITAAPAAMSKSAFVQRQAAALGYTWIGTDAALA